MQPLRRKIAIKLGHQIHEHTLDLFVYWRYTSHYYLFDFHFTRPARGQRRFDLRCPACGKDLMLRLDSVERTKQIRKRYLTTALTGSAVVAATVALGGFVHLPLPGTVEAVVLIAFLLSLPVTPIAWWLWRIEDGIRLTDPTGKRRKGHWRAGSPRLSGA
ncbi:hypothetical protein [Glycomyces albidus]|uniref:Uncharacterized protein n=1 Tax=Glycomyces albidus TaxID=2656774 RepID=A0A6L5GE07_9ACTN|nr:hypothetical protein [Glycomyces albidus]MQM27927.1 hypothetical protein [Glycomyces albidus]